MNRAGKDSPIRILLGAEAHVEVYPDRIVKRRLPKAYRHPQLDKYLRSERTRREARLLERAARLGLTCPPLHVEGDTLILPRLSGSPVSEMYPHELPEGLVNWLAHALRRLHTTGIAHGDITPRNILQDGRGTYWLIDFGLAFPTRRWEDWAYDIAMTRHTFSEYPGFSEELYKAYFYLLSPREQYAFEERYTQILRRGRHKHKQPHEALL